MTLADGYAIEGCILLINYFIHRHEEYLPINYPCWHRIIGHNPAKKAEWVTAIKLYTSK
jgi:hypothetical protein